ncbi:hypothetical protein N2152v2_008994 [Parachlorella kessleri]
MASLLSALPAPTRDFARPEPVSSTALATTGGPRVAREPPPYGQRHGFVPRRLDDFGDGGAFPEIHVAQYPLDMGRPGQRAGGLGGKGDQTLALTVNAEGEVNYDAIVKQGKLAQKWVASTHGALVPKVDQLNPDALARPDEEAIEETAKETAAALQRMVEKKIGAENPKTLPAQPGSAQYIKYTPSQQSTQHASGATTRIIKMQDMPVDPLEPPKFRHIKVPRGPGSPPVPVMHSPPRPLTVKDQQDWKIPPCISNWKNAKGYTIPLDKRLAADGRGLQEVAINDQFAKFTEALYIAGALSIAAEQKARSAVEARAKMQRELLAREKERKERELRELALKARMDRMGVAAAPAAAAAAGGAVPAGVPEAGGRVPLAARAEGRVLQGAAMDVSDDEREDRHGGRRQEREDGGRERESREEGEERRRRDEIREERRRERERERRLEAKDAHGHKKSKLTRDRDRDISEKVALGMAKVTGGEAMYDQRLFNQETGTGTGFASEDAYNLYDKPLFADRSELFRHKAGRDDEAYAGGAGGEEGDVNTARFKPDKGFTGADYGKGGEGGPVQFEKDPEEADPFGLDQFLSDVRAGKKRGALDNIGKSGGMRAAGGGSSYDQDAGGSGRRMDFVSGGR